LTDSYTQGEFLFLLQKTEKRREISPCDKTLLSHQGVRRQERDHG
jgi:hypothetical protein